MSARECKEDWFPTRTGVEKRGKIEFRPESTIKVVFVIFVTCVAKAIAMRRNHFPYSRLFVYKKFNNTVFSSEFKKFRMTMFTVVTFNYLIYL